MNLKYAFPLLIFLIFFSLISPGQSQQTEFKPIRIDRVMILGNDKTKREVILREIPFKFPATLDMADFKLIQNRLLNLYLFKRIDLNIFNQGTENILIIQVYESWYLYPVPIFRVNDRDWSKLSYGFQLSHLNFRGRNEKLNVGGWVGYNPSFFIGYFNPWLGKTSRFTFSISLFQRRIYNRSFHFDEKQLGGRISLGKRLTLNSTFRVNMEYRRIRLPDSVKTLSESGNGVDMVPRLGFGFTSDTRDLRAYSLSGHLIDWRVSRTGFTSRQAQYWRNRTDLRIFKKLNSHFSIGARNFTILNFGTLPVYDLIYLGYGERIRGYFKNVFTGQNLMLQSMEIRIPLMNPRFFSLSKAPGINTFTQNLKFALSLAIFSDAGIVWNRTEQFQLSRFRTGYGLGLNIIMPFNSLLRIEYALNDRGSAQWIFDGRVSF